MFVTFLAIFIVFPSDLARFAATRDESAGLDRRRT
jgi:hypothetical protein